MKESQALYFEAGAEGLGTARQVIRSAAGTPTDALAILFPGFNYSCDRSLLYFTAAAYGARGRDILNVTYPDLRAKAFEAQPEDVQMAQFRAFARSVATGVAATGQYTRLALVGKSLGTVAVAEVVTSAATDGAECECVLLTPLASEPVVARAVPSLPRTLVVLGDDDAGSPDCRALFGDLAGVEMHSLAGGHSLEVDDPLISIDVLGSYLDVLARWLDR